MRIHRNCCGIDVHKKGIAVCVIIETDDGAETRQKRLFGTMTGELRALAQWLCECRVSAVAMEATGVYWMPVWNVLESYGLFATDAHKPGTLQSCSREEDRSEGRGADRRTASRWAFAGKLRAPCTNPHIARPDSI